MIPDAIYAGWNARARGAAAEDAWAKRFAEYRAAHPDLAAEFTRRIHGELPATWKETAGAFIAAQAAKGETVATRKASQQSLEAYAKALPELLGGAADLTGSVFTNWSGTKPVTHGGAGNYINFGVREFAMCAIANGLGLYGGYIPYVGTFLTFSDYARNALRMAALMKLRAIYVFTHDSIGLGEDGPTHQSIEHAASLRLIPHMDVWRPCDTVETAVAWAAAIERADGPTCLLFTRQNVPFEARDAAQIASIRRGGYVLADWNGASPKRVVIIATGSEIGLAMGARTALAADGIAARVVSMPSTNVFDRQDASWRTSVLPAGVPRVAVEAGSTSGWHKYVGAIDDGHGAIVGLDTYGESAPAAVLFKHFNFTVENVVATVKRVVHERRRIVPRPILPRMPPQACPPILIRRATARDAPAIARVRVDSWRTTYRGMIPDAYLDGMQVEASTALWDRVLTAGPNTTCVFVAEHGTDIVGFGAGNRLQPAEARLRCRADCRLPAARIPARGPRSGAGRRRCQSTARAWGHGFPDLGHRGQQACARILRTPGRRACRRAAVSVGRHGLDGSGLWLARPVRARRRLRGRTVGNRNLSNLEK